MGGAYSSEEQLLEKPVVNVNKLAATRSDATSITSRYTCDRTFEQDFAVDQVLGHGMNGPVRCATSQADGRMYAVKSLKKTHLPRVVREALQNEAELLLTLDHPHIAKLHMVYESHEVLHLVMELLQGGELYDRVLQAKTYAEEMAVDSTYQMLLALSYLHGQNIVHRDLKMENFVYRDTGAGHLKLIDFGSATVWDPSTMMSQPCGSLLYVAPEVLRQCYTVQSDMWSLGIVTYMMLTGKPAFFGTKAEILRKTRAGQPRYAKGFWQLSWPAQSFIQSLLVQNPRSRMTAEQALQHPWIKERHLRQCVHLRSQILDGLQASTQSSDLCPATLRMRAWSLLTEEQAELCKRLLSRDAAERGTIKLKDVQEVLGETFHMDSAEAQRLLASINPDNRQEIDFSEFVAAASEDQARDRKDAMHRSFQAFDHEHSGQIWAQELKPVLGISSHKIEEDLCEVDTSGDGMTDDEEFSACSMKEPEGLEELEIQSVR